MREPGNLQKMRSPQSLETDGSQRRATRKNTKNKGLFGRADFKPTELDVKMPSLLKATQFQTEPSTEALCSGGVCLRKKRAAAAEGQN